MQKMRTRVTCWFLTALTMLTVFITMNPQQVYGTTSDDSIIKVGYIDYGGFIEPDGNGDCFGYGVDYLSEISNYTGWKYEYVYDSFSNLLEKLKTGEIDILCQTQKTPEREENYLFSDYQVGVEIAALYVSEKNSGDYYYDDAETLDGMSVAMMSGSSQNEIFTDYAVEKGFSYNPIYYDTVTECFNAVSDGMADGLVMGSLAGQDKEGLRVAGRFSVDPYYIMTGKQNTKLLEEVNQAQKELSIHEPYLEATLFEKYYENTAAFSEVLYTREEGEYIASNPDIKVALKPDSIPLSDYSDADGAYGIFKDILSSISDNCGLNISFTGRTIGEDSEQYLNDHEDGATVGVFSNNASQKGMIFSNALYTTTTALVGRVGERYSIDTNQRAYTVAVPRSYKKVIQYINEQYPKYKVKTYSSYEECLRAVQNKQADYATLTVEIVTNELDNPHFGNLAIVNAGFMTEEYCLAMKDTSQNRLAISIVNKSFRSLTSDYVEQIKVNHMSKDRYNMSFSDMLYRYRYQMIMIVFLLLAVFALLIAYIVLRNNSMRKIQISAEKAEKANHAKSEFLSRMSHDIRTPLNAVLGYAGLAKMDIKNGKDPITDIQQIQESGSFLLGLVNDVLDMSKIESGAIELLYEPISMEEFLEQIKALFSEKCRERNITLHIDSKGAIPYIRVDKIRFKQIFFNLISNAVKFTEDNGNIWFTVTGRKIKEEKLMVCIMVKDDGIGMSKEFQNHVFEAFSQEKVSASGMEGSGLGLSIVKQLVTLMNGTISCQSKAGAGTEFYVEIPTTICTKEDMEVTKQKISSRVSLKGKKILLCEDHPINAALATRLLEQEGMEVVQARNG